VLSVKAEQVAAFLGRKITPKLTREIGSQFSTRIEGPCIKHRFGSVSKDVRQARPIRQPSGASPNTSSSPLSHDADFMKNSTSVR